MDTHAENRGYYVLADVQRVARESLLPCKVNGIEIIITHPVLGDLRYGTDQHGIENAMSDLISDFGAGRRKQ